MGEPWSGGIKGLGESGFGGTMVCVCQGLGVSGSGDVGVWGYQGLRVSGFGSVGVWGIEIWGSQGVGVSGSGGDPTPRRGCGSELGSPGAPPAAPVINGGN